MGAHRLSGQTQKVRFFIFAVSGTLTPHSMFPVSLNGTSVLPVLYRISLEVSISQAFSLKLNFSKIIVKEGLFFSSTSSYLGISFKAKNFSLNSFLI